VNVVCTLAGFAAGLVFGIALACSLPMLTAWGERMAARAQDDEGGGVGGVTLASVKLHPPVPWPDPPLLERHAAAAAAACLAAGVPASYVPPDKKKAS
jgi:hypothetical protein